LLRDSSAKATLIAENIKRAKEFYTKKLGLEIEMDSGKEIILKSGKNTRILIYEKGKPKADNTVVSFDVDNVQNEVNELRKRGVKFEEYDMPGIKTVNGVATSGNLTCAWFKDSEGNILNISHTKK